ncbi:MAG: PAS domain S-box protein [Actinomycetota bacterium]|nr:PAS domain S-box protein [Actinomycetota bacterium]
MKAADPRRDSAIAQARVPLRVLIVEDSSDDALLLLRELERGGYEPLHERVDTPEAMRQALAEGGPWDVVLSDWQMPRFSGADALAMLLEIDSEVPFIIVSGKVGEEMAVEAMKAGAHDYVMKGNLARLCATVERGLEEARARREREQAQKSLEESEERFRSLVMNSSDMITVFAPDGTRLYASPSIQRVLGYKPEDTVGGSAFDLVHPDDAPKVREEFAELARTPGTGRPFEFRLRHADGSWRVFESIGANLLDAPSVGGLVFNARDVTDRKRTEEALKESEERYRRLVELSPDMIVVHDGGEVLFANAAGAELFGAASPEELTGKPVMNLIHPGYREIARARIIRSQEKGKPAELLQEKYLRLDGRAVDVEVVTIPITYRDRAATLVVARDITERKRAEEALRRRDAILRAVAFAAERFLKQATPWQESAQEVLERLGQAAEVSRVYIFENYAGVDGAVLPTKRYEWLAPGIEAGADNPTMVDLPHRTADYSRWAEILGRGDPVCGHTRDFPEEERPALEADSTLSIALVSIFVEGDWWGFIGFDECTSERDWSAAETEALQAAADTLGAAIQRERSEEAIRQSEQLYRTVVEQATEYISLVDVETKRIVGSNPAFREALGYTEEELGHMTLYDIVAHDRESIDQNARWVLRRGRYSIGERKHRRKNGSLVDVEVNASAISYGGREVICVVGHDVTERRRKEEELRESQRALATLMSNLPGMAYRCRNDPDRTMGFVSAGCSELTGYPPEDLVGNRQKSYGDLIHPEDREAVWQSVQAALRERRPFQFNYRITAASGAMKWVWEQGRGVFSPEGTLLALEGFIADITERERARDALVQSEERYRAVVEQAAEGIFLFDAATGDILESNAAFEELLGYTTGELLSMKLYDFVAHDRESIDSNIRLVLEEGGRFVGERRYRRKDGSLADVAVSANLISYDGREVICTVIRDVTERVEAFRMLEERVTALARISASLTIDRPMETTLDALAAGIVEGTAAVACAVVLIDAQTGMLRLAGSHGLPEGYTAGLEASWRAGAWSPSVQAFRSRQPFLFHDARRVILDDPLYAPIHQFVREVPWDTMKYLPLVSRGQALGTINLYYLPEQEPGEDESVFLDAVADQTAVAVENARLFAAAQGKAALEERQRLARELHDSVSQALYGIALGSRTAHALLDREDPPERVSEWLEYVLSLAEAGLTEMRALIFELRPESLETEGLIAALKQQAAALGARHEIPVEATLGEEPDLPLETKEALYRIAQEALHNTVKHARASRADLKLECDTRDVTLEISDDGAGFDPSEDFSGHLGLKSMRERAARLGGTLQVESAPGEGTRIRARIPSAT